MIRRLLSICLAIFGIIAFMVSAVEADTTFPTYVSGLPTYGGSIGSVAVPVVIGGVAYQVLGSVFGGSGSSAFSAITGGTNTTAAMLVGTGASLGPTGSGAITATAMPASGLTGSSLPSGITGSSLTSLGTLGSLTVSGVVTLTGVEGAGTYCVQISSSGALSNTGAACGSGSGAVNSVTGTAGQVTASPTTGAVIVGLPATITQAETFSAGAVVDTSFTATGLVTNADLVNSGLTLGSTALTLGGTTTTVAGLTLTTPTINGAALSGTLSGTPTFSGNLTFSGQPTFSGSLTGTQTTCLGLTSGGVLAGSGSACGSGGSPAFSALTSGTNTTAAMLVGSGASLGASGSGTIAATTMPAVGLTGQVAVANGGTGLASLTAGTLPMGAGTSPFVASEITDISSGGVVIGSPTGGQKGAGTINMTGCFINNVACATSGGGGVTWPANADLVVSNGTSSPAGLAPVNNDLAYGAAGAWAALASANSSVLVTSSGGVPSLSTTLPSGLTIPGFNASVTWPTSGDIMVSNGGNAPTGIVPGSGVAAALAVNVGSAGAFVTNGGALGTPSSGTLTNATGLPLSTGVTGTLAAAQFPALTGAVTTTAGSLATTLAANAVGTSNIAASAVTYAKLQNETASTLLGNPTGSSAAPSEITLGTNLSFSGGVLNAAGGSGTPVFFAGPTTAGSANTYTQAATVPSGFALTNGYVVRTAINASNTGASTLNVNSTGATPVEKQLASGLAALSGGELSANHVYDFTYNSTCTCFIVTNTDGSAVVSGFTSATVSQPQWANVSVLAVTAASQTVTLPSATTLAANGGLFIQAIGNSVTLTPQSTDAINGGTLGASVTLASGGTYLVTTSHTAGATAFSESGGGGGGGSGTVSNCSTADALAIYAATGTTVSCPSGVGSSGQVLTSNGAGVAPTFQAGGSGGVPALPGYNTGAGVDANWGYPVFSSTSLAALTWSTATNYDQYWPFVWNGFSANVVRFSARVQTFSSPTGSPVLYARIYSVNSSGQPGTCLLDFTPSAGIVPSATGIITVTVSPGAALVPGTMYYLDLAEIGLTGGTIALSNPAAIYDGAGYQLPSAVIGVSSGQLLTSFRATGPTAGACPGTANLTGLATQGLLGPIFGLGSS